MFAADAGAPANSNRPVQVVGQGNSGKPADAATVLEGAKTKAQPPPNAADAAKAKPAKVKGPKADPAGVWKWTTRNRNGQSIENELTITVAKDGTITGTLFDGSGTYPIVKPTVEDDVLSFTVVHQSPGIDDVSLSYSVSLDSNDPKVSVEKPDFTPAGKAVGKKHKQETGAVHEKGPK